VLREYSYTSYHHNTFPGPPGLTVVPGGDLVSFNFSITPSTPPDCVVNYTIIATSGGVSRDITVPAGRVDGSTPVNVGGFNVCGANHSFIVAPVISDGQTGPSSDSVDIQALDQGMYTHNYAKPFFIDRILTGHCALLPAHVLREYSYTSYHHIILFQVLQA
jgi:hypothetical protein